MATSLGIVGNVVIDYHNFLYFLDYFVPTILLVGLMYLRVPILKLILNVDNYLMAKVLRWRDLTIKRIADITGQRVILFTRGGRLDRLHAAGVGLIITVDSCVSDREFIRYGNELGLDLDKFYALCAGAAAQSWTLQNRCPIPGVVPAAPYSRLMP